MTLPAIPPEVLPWLLLGAGAALGLLLTLFFHRSGILAWIASLVRDPTTGDGSSKRTAGMAMIAAGIGVIVRDPEQWPGGAVLITGGFTALGIASNAGGATALSSAIGALRGPPKPEGGGG